VGSIPPAGTTKRYQQPRYQVGCNILISEMPVSLGCVCANGFSERIIESGRVAWFLANHLVPVQLMDYLSSCLSLSRKCMYVEELQEATPPG
jgi:hypothetical protein